jgi:hypothetical protein
MYDFSKCNVQNFIIDLTRTVKPEETFNIRVSQQGNRIGKERLKIKPFEPAAIKILLKKDGKIIARRYYRGFNNFLEIDDCEILPGRYEIVIEPLWNDSALSDPAHQIMCVDLLCPEKVEISVIKSF